MSACLICCEEKDWITLGKCNHTELCLECCYKYRSDKKNRNCILCKTDLEVVYVVKNNEDYADFSCFSSESKRWWIVESVRWIRNYSTYGSEKDRRFS